MHAKLQAITVVGNRQLITRPKSADFNELPVDPSAVRTPQVTDDDFAVGMGHATMPPRDARGTKVRITARIAAHNNQGAIQGNIRSVIESHNTCVHGG
jgi:hypothetical protein